MNQEFQILSFFLSELDAKDRRRMPDRRPTILFCIRSTMIYSRLKSSHPTFSTWFKIPQTAADTMMKTIFRPPCDLRHRFGLRPSPDW
jgi:hypothetical protein